MDTPLKKAMLSALAQFASVKNQSHESFSKELLSVFNSDKIYMDKLVAMDAAFDDQPLFEPLRELFFDLLLINFFNEDVRKLEADYLESPEWEQIEEQTIDRGTELLNLILYLQECKDEAIEPELSDFLREFLLVDEDEFQDEHRIYEVVIANQILVDSSIKELARVSSSIPEDSELKELFYPMMGFFREPDPSDEDFNEFIKYSPNPDFDSAVYALLLSFNHQN